MKYFSMLIKPASSSCNMRCEYCFYADVSAHREIQSHGIMAENIMESLIQKTIGFFKEEVMITYAFQGGEPTLAGLDYFKKFIQQVNKVKKDYHHIQYALQTNGLLIDDDWICFLKEHQFLVGISLDGFVQQHDRYRKDHNHEGTYEKIMWNVRKLRQAGVEFNILTVLTSSLAKYPKELFRFYAKNDFKYVQLIPCLPELDNKKDIYALKPKEFFHFYDEFYQLWLKEWKKGNPMSVTFFDNLIGMMAGIPPQQCGYLGYCTNQFVCESDGSIYPCDFYVLDEYRIGQIQYDSLSEIATSQKVKTFIQEKRVYCKKCESCKYIGICHGQCKRMSICYYDEAYCGLQEFIKKHEKTLIDVAKTIRR